MDGRWNGGLGFVWMTTLGARGSTEIACGSFDHLRPLEKLVLNG
jgi:hypothetical protein